MTAPILPGAEPYSAAGDARGALVLHGFTGNPQSMRGLALALADAGLTRGAAAASRARHRGGGHGPHPLGGLVGRRRGGLRRAGGALRVGRRRRPLHGRHPERLAGRAPSGDCRTRAGQPPHRATRRGHGGVHRRPDRRWRRAGSRHRVRHRPGGRGRSGLRRASAARRTLPVRGGRRGRGRPRRGDAARSCCSRAPRTTWCRRCRATAWSRASAVRWSGSCWSAASTWPPSTTTRTRSRSGPWRS